MPVTYAAIKLGIFSLKSNITSRQNLDRLGFFVNITLDLKSGILSTVDTEHRYVQVVLIDSIMLSA